MNEAREDEQGHNSLRAGGFVGALRMRGHSGLDFEDGQVLGRQRW